MQPDLLQQLRDLHLPADPAWWPPAPGWWLLGLLAIGGVVLLIRGWLGAYRRRLPFREARRLYARLHDDYRAGRIDETGYLHGSNELLKRLVIFGVGARAARRANDQTWLALLDELSGSSEFTTGPGRALGNQRFAEHARADVDALHPLLASFLAKAHPP